MSYPNDSQAFHADLKSGQFDYTELPLINHSGKAGAAQYGDAGRYSPKELVQMEDINPIPAGSSSIPKNDSRGSSFHMFSAVHLWQNPGIETVSNAIMDTPLPYRDSGYETTDKSDDGIHLDGNPTSLPMEKSDKSFVKWQNEGEDPTLSYLNKGQIYKLSISDSKPSVGVKGTPIRLCVKVQELMFPVNLPKPEDPGICFCKIQLFRDHGAEREMSNDNRNLTKTTGKLKQEMSSAMLKPVAKKRKMDRVSESINEVLELKRSAKLEMQTRAITGWIQTLRGSKEDDPDLYPVHMSNYQESDIYSDISSAHTVTTESKDSGSERFTPIDADNFDGKKAGVYGRRLNQKHRMGSTSSAVSTEQPKRLVACFYVQLMLESSQQFYRAIYLSERTTHDLALAISTKYGITLTDGFNIYHVGDKDLKLVEDEFVRQIPEGQHMGIQLDHSRLLYLLYGT
ncbi:transcriptional regulator family: Grainyhead/CP2 [Penicillium sp. IBT 35674x]|nr:transcriptional regulator family: Grainyhead/CP2 [Penicillium sp. IBT 35674x]